jgi:hypothetical protein
MKKLFWGKFWFNLRLGVGPVAAWKAAKRTVAASAAARKEMDM